MAEWTLPPDTIVTAVPPDATQPPDIEDQNRQFEASIRPNALPRTKPKPRVAPPDVVVNLGLKDEDLLTKSAPALKKRLEEDAKLASDELKVVLDYQRTLKNTSYKQRSRKRIIAKIEEELHRKERSLRQAQILEIRNQGTNVAMVDHLTALDLSVQRNPDPNPDQPLDLSLKATNLNP